MAERVRIEGFLPSTSAFHFANTWPPGPMLTIPFPTRPIGIGNASNGLCGGMTFAVRDFFEHGMKVPADRSPPAAGTPLYRYFVRRLIESYDLPRGVWGYMSRMAPPKKLDVDTIHHEWPKIRNALRGGHLATLGLIRTRSFWPGALGQNHQCLAWGYDRDDDDHIILCLYDPNHPDDDDVALTFAIRDPHGPSEITFRVGGIAVAGGETTVGCFLTAYRQAAPAPVLVR